MRMISNYLVKGLFGVLGIVGVEVVSTAEALDPETITEAGSIIIQILIAIASLFGIFRKKKGAGNIKK